MVELLVSRNTIKLFQMAQSCDLFGSGSGHSGEFDYDLLLV